MEATTHTHALQRIVNRAVATTASVYGYPLVEVLRTCRLQTRSCADPASKGRVPIDMLHHRLRPPAERVMWAEGPPTVLSTAWINLADGPRHLLLRRQCSWAARPGLISFHDAYGERFAELQRSEVPDGGVVLLGPQTSATWGGGDFQVLQCATDLLWVIVRSAVQGDAGDTLRQVASEMQLFGATGTMNGRRPAAVDLWEGPASDVFSDFAERGEASEPLASAFYGNLCRALLQFPPKADDAALVRSFRQAGLQPCAALEWQALPPKLREDLVLGFEDAAATVIGAAFGECGVGAAGSRFEDMPRSPHLAAAVRARHWGWSCTDSNCPTLRP